MFIHLKEPFKHAKILQYYFVYTVFVKFEKKHQSIKKKEKK